MPVTFGDLMLNGPSETRFPGHRNFSFPLVQSLVLLSQVPMKSPRDHCRVAELRQFQRSTRIQELLSTPSHSRSSASLGFSSTRLVVSRIMVGRLAIEYSGHAGRPGAAGVSPLMKAAQARWTCFAEGEFFVEVGGVRMGAVPDEGNVEGVVGESGEASAALGEVEAVHEGSASALDESIGDADRRYPVFLGGDGADAGLEVLHLAGRRVCSCSRTGLNLARGILPRSFGGGIGVGMRSDKERALVAIGADEQALAFA